MLSTIRSLRSALTVAMLVISAAACRTSNDTNARTARVAHPGRVVFALNQLDGIRLPTAYADPLGRFTLRGAELVLDPDGSVRWEIRRLPEPDSTHGHIDTVTYVGSYRRAGEDSLVFPAGAATTPEIFGRLDGRGGLKLVSHPLPTASGAPSGISAAARMGGAHVWKFDVAQ